MATDWTLLEPWSAAVRASFVRYEPTDFTSEMQVSLEWPFRISSEQRELFLMIDLEAEVTPSVLKLIQIQEAMNLFTFLSAVDNKAFRERFPHITLSMSQNDRSWYPSWRLYVRGSATVQQDTWSSLFAFSGTSPQFQQTIETLRVMGFEYTSKRFTSQYIHVGWACKFNGAEVDMRATIHFDNIDAFNGMKTGLQKLFQVGVPLVKQLGLIEDASTLVDPLQDQSVSDEKQVPIEILFVTIRDFTTTYSRVLAALAWLPIRILKMDFNRQNATAKMEATVHLNQAGPSFYSDTVLKCDKISSNILPAIYSAMQSLTRPIEITLDAVDSESWPLVMDVICCGSSVRISLSVKNVILTNSDLLKMADVAVPWQRQPSVGHGVYEISHNSEERNLQISSEFHRLQLAFTDFESGSLVVNLLDLIGRSLHSLVLGVSGWTPHIDITLDLSELSAVCANLKYLETYGIHVVVSAHTEALRLWPIRCLRLDTYSKLIDLTSCLRNPKMRMMHELTSITIKDKSQKVNEEQKRELMLHDGDFLSITKEKVPIRSKAAMISVINCATHTKMICRLHEDVLRLIFVFASTPDTRSVTFPKHVM